MTTTLNDPQIDVFEFLNRLRQQDVEVWAEGERLRFSAPKGALTPELRAELGRRKSEILALLHTAGDRGRVPLERVARTEELPLSFSQLRLWFLEQFEPGTVAFHMPEAVRLIGRLDVAALGRSLREIGSRHESLRTTFGAVEGRPVQVIAPEPRIEMPVVDLRALPREGKEKEAEVLALVAARTCFDLERGPLVRTVLLKLDEAEHIFLITFHHLVFDRWSMGVFLAEMTALYKAFSSGPEAFSSGPEAWMGPSPLPELAIQYADFAHWQRQWLQGEVWERLLDYWRRQLDDAPAVLELPCDRPRPPVRTENGARQPAFLPAELTTALKKLCRERDVSLYMVLLAASKVLLWRWTGQKDLSVGTVIANRNRPELEPLIGFLLNTLVLRTQLEGMPGFDALLERVREVALGAFAHQELPFEQLIEELQPERELAYAPFFQVMVVLQNTPTPGIELAGLTTELLDYEGVVTANSDLGFWLWEDGDTIGGYSEYNTDLFDSVTILRMFDELRSLLEAIVREPTRSLARLPILPPAARHQLFGEWNDVPAPPRDEACFHELFEAQAERIPDEVALVFEQTELNYGELNARANRLAHYLRRLGVGPETGVGIFLEYSPEMVVAALGVMKSGGAFLPLDATHTRQRIGELLEGAEVAALLTQEELRGDLPATFQPPVVCLDADWEEISRESAENLPPLARPANLVYRVYTSGTTGRPKGVMISHAALMNIFHGHRLAYGLDGDMAHLQMASFSFDVFVGDMVRAFGTGGKLVMCPRDILLLPDELYAFMRRQGANAAEFVPAVLRGLMEHAVKSGQDLDFMRLIAVASDVWYVREYDQLRRQLAPNARVSGTYGVTEVNIDSTTFQSDVAALPLDACVPVGRPFAGNPLFILDRHGNPAPPGALGEMCIGGIGVARGYFDRPADTAEKFIPDAWSGAPGTRLYRTGDRVRYLHDGNVEFLGRVDFQVKIRGFRIEPGEIEAILGEHPEVVQGVVMAREEPPGNRHLVAYIVSHADPAPATSELRRFLKERLPDYMVPAVFVYLDALPLNKNNKVDRQRLPAPTPGEAEEKDYTAPRTPLEEALAEIFQEVTGAERVGADDDFFELGGHSLLATQVVSRVREVFEIELPVRSLFESPVVSELAVIIGNELIARVEGLSESEAEALL